MGTKAASPKYSIGAKLEMEIGGAVPSWVKSIPGPAKYKYDADVFRTRSPKFTIGTKLPSESDLRSKRGPDKISVFNTSSFTKAQPKMQRSRNLLTLPSPERPLSRSGS